MTDHIPSNEGYMALVDHCHGNPRDAADEILKLRRKLNFANREPPHCPTCDCGPAHETPAAQCNCGCYSGGCGRPEGCLCDAECPCGSASRHAVKANALHKCKGCGAEGEPGSPDYCSADCLDNAVNGPAPLKCPCGRDLVPYAGCPVCDVPTSSELA